MPRDGPAQSYLNHSNLFLVVIDLSFGWHLSAKYTQPIIATLYMSGDSGTSEAHLCAASAFVNKFLTDSKNPPDKLLP
ncbi:protein of unknown function [Aminobacter niigataensis]|nr:protein of unknown function [Aminobacter niigataensis]